MIEFELVYLSIFMKSLDEIVSYFESEFSFSEAQIEAFVTNIERKIQSLSFQPAHHQDVAAVYGFSEATYRIDIGKYYRLFYRVDELEKKVYIGRVFNQGQMKLNFDD
ncbi:type II toxin-antitoxin system RelE/ParE family toxin [Lactovum odontotermitis]